jgi:hypothetical protein
MLRIPMHNMGVIDRYNGNDVLQTRHYIKLHCSTYLKKMLNSHTWLDTQQISINPTPFPTDKTYLRQLQDTTVPQTQAEKESLQHKMKFKYRQVMGEIMFPMVKCRPDISPHCIILSQYMDNPGEQHYKALSDILRYLANTIDHGLYYWRLTPLQALDEYPLPNTMPDTYTLMETGGTNSFNLIAYVDSDWASSMKQRNSITGTILMFAGAAVGYKMKVQPIIAHSSTEAEFIAACDTAKMILFF